MCVIVLQSENRICQQVNEEGHHEWNDEMPSASDFPRLPLSSLPACAAHVRASENDEICKGQKCFLSFE